MNERPAGMSEKAWGKRPMRYSNEKQNDTIKLPPLPTCDLDYVLNSNTQQLADYEVMIRNIYTDNLFGDDDTVDELAPEADNNATGADALFGNVCLMPQDPQRKKRCIKIESDDADGEDGANVETAIDKQKLISSTTSAKDDNGICATVRTNNDVVFEELQ